MTRRVSPGQAPPLFIGGATLLFTSWTAVSGRGGGGTCVVAVGMLALTLPPGAPFALQAGSANPHGCEVLFLSGVS